MEFGPKNKEEAAEYAVARMRVDVQQALYSLMKSRGVSHKGLAEMMGVSEVLVDQIFSHRGNPTIDTLARAMHALGSSWLISAKQTQQGHEHG